MTNQIINFKYKLGEKVWVMDWNDNRIRNDEIDEVAIDEDGIRYDTLYCCNVPEEHLFSSFVLCLNFVRSYLQIKKESRINKIIANSGDFEELLDGCQE